MITDIVYNKIQIIERCIKRIHEEYDNNPENLRNYTKQDSIILNIQRACEACIDLAMHIAADEKLGIPQNSRDAFELLYQNGIINDTLAIKMKRMVGFRNIVVHDYQAVNLSVIKKIIENHLVDFKEFTEAIIQKTRL
ncbi:Uncharacterized conserved protein YutE, UPF0331/DUF86 family [Caloramator quimbayensis]|uniref:Uncharacterized conserved protein YutE, UPF0331/DUF86 family n=1 Tax=Caloramator quimbayensis TaxID=1147123 RepID=A0A1T4X495_9CLOT|nr:DUF86 domain-containing protein [Caloramator quimbayensis]SKA84444.1 Uncharacterized conserved protein YutE, UPF0331/DUF86 family [Caloramator quimbayensis]